MTSRIVETYRGFRILMEVKETSTHWTWSTRFERQGTSSGPVGGIPPISFSETAPKADTGALNLGMSLLGRAEGLIDDWYARGNG